MQQKLTRGTFVFFSKCRVEIREVQREREEEEEEEEVVVVVVVVVVEDNTKPEGGIGKDRNGASFFSFGGRAIAFQLLPQCSW